MQPFDQLIQRHSTPSRLLGEPGPDSEQLDRLLALAVRVPDHGALAPWRILAITDDARLRLGEFVQQRGLERNPMQSEAAQTKDRERFTRAPMVLTVIASPVDRPGVPEIEQILSAGAVCFNLVQGAHALGLGAQWLTGWPVYDASIKAHLGLNPREHIVGFIHIGTPTHAAPERARPDPAAHFSIWQG
ncbi:MAG TPA: nitroreductase [Chiayiivirga sp.]|nr:nitroreductase [Chiayiivirga sp.]